MSPLERVYARWCARRVLHLWSAPEVVRRWIETGDESIRAEAAAAAMASDAPAAESAWAAAWAAPWPPAAAYEAAAAARKVAEDEDAEHLAQRRASGFLGALAAKRAEGWPDEGIGCAWLRAAFAKEVTP